jgi:secreted protein with Ig-like and vWFA domain
MTHEMDPRITAYVFGELSTEDRGQFETELQASPVLCRLVDETRQTLDLLCGELQSEPPLNLTDRQRELLSRKIATSPASAPALRTEGARRRVWHLAAVLAASLLVMGSCGIAWLLGRQDRLVAVGDVPAAVTQAAGDSSASSEPPAAMPAPPEINPSGLMHARQSQDPPAAMPTLDMSPDSASFGGGMMGSAAYSADGGFQYWSQDVDSYEGYGDSMYGSSSGYGGYGMGLGGMDYEMYYDPMDGDMPTRVDRGLGPGMAGDRHATIDENPFIPVKIEPLSTFSIDVDTASYSKLRQYLLQHHMLPRRDAVRIEELINYFRYEYEPPAGSDAFAAQIEVAECPWTPAHRLVRIGIKGREIERDSRPSSNLVFLLDVSGSMNRPNRLPLVKRSMKMLVDQLGENDRVAIVVYAGAAGMVLDSTPGDRKSVIIEALDRLQAGGSTNGGQGIQLAYQVALDHFVPGGVNRVILCTDGDFNVGVTGTDELVQLVEEHAKRGIFLSVLGFGMGNHNDAMLEELSNRGNGNYAFIDTDAEARKVLVEQLSGTLVTIAKDVKIQVEFNPAQVAAYRLIGYENRLLAAQDFNDDRKDAGDIGAGHTVTALYEIVPAGADGQLPTPPVDELRYQQRGNLTDEAKSGELLTLKIRYKQPDGDTSTKLTFPIEDRGYRFSQASKDFRFAAAVASFGMLLRNSPYQGNATYAGVLETAMEAAEGDTTGYRKEFLSLVSAAMALGERRQ